MINESLCPYPGLRPFNEEESIFFKGRDEHIQKITSMLEANHFVMVTGASGDGKSSIVYAGVIPHAKAGFFKAEFNNWVIADFRPEKSPLENFARSVNKNLAINDIEKVESELRLGFSSLMDLYCSSSYYVDQNSNEFVTLDSNQKKGKLKKAANLLILVDQFEEFFTNSENFSNETLSEDSKIAGNVILETAAIALARKLPVYIVCTMRSDYIGQCPAFTKLPEFIGFSQFFVPRLKRKELQQVITEPAKLAGCKISNRLTQSLINNLGEGVDQLPVLQHALRQIWKMADEGHEEMDLIHLTKCGGLSPSWLNKEDRLLFDDWFSSLTVLEKDLLKRPSLENLLNAHANELYYKTSLENYFELTGNEITREECELIIKKVFQCLTLTDQGRTVRNRMTLRQIVQIINKEGIDENKVSAVLYVFRIPGNTFIRPFVDETNAEKFLFPETILDITHESLIRNWTQLKSWTEEENNNYLNFLDFEKQLERWTNNNKTPGYLLPIGPLTYFETWYNQCEPNARWIERYNNSDEVEEIKFSNAEHKLAEIREFISKSARKLIFTRTMLKYGAGKIAGFFGIIALISMCIYYYLDYRRKQNDYVLNEISENCIKMLPSNKIGKELKSKFLIAYFRLHPESFTKLMNNLNNDTLAFDIGYKVFENVENFSDPWPHKICPMVDTTFNFLTDMANKLSVNNNNGKDDYYLRIGRYVRLLVKLNLLNYRSKEIDSLLNFYSGILYDRYVSDKIYSNQSGVNSSPAVFLNCMELILYNKCSNKKIEEIIKSISPFENEVAHDRFDRLFPAGDNLLIDKDWEINYYIDHQGGYQILAYLYAAQGNYEKLNQCLDSLLELNTAYSSYENESFSNILATLINYQPFPSLKTDLFIQKYSNRTNIIYTDIWDLILDNLGKEYVIGWGGNGSKTFCADNLNTFLLNKKFDLIWNNYFDKLSNEKLSSDELNFIKAIRYKQKGLQYSIMQRNYTMGNTCFKSALDYYYQVSLKYRNEFVIKNGRNGDSLKNVDLFLFPNHIYFRANNRINDDSYDYRIPRTEFRYMTFFQYLTGQKKYPLFSDQDEINAYNKILRLYVYGLYVGPRPARNNFNENLVKVGLKINEINKDKVGLKNYQFVCLLDYFENLIGNRGRRETIKRMQNSEYITFTKNNVKSTFKRGTNEFNQFLKNDDFHFDTDSDNVSKVFKKLNLDYLLSEKFQESNDDKNKIILYLFKAVSEELIINDSISLAFRFINAIGEPFMRKNVMIEISNDLVKYKMAEKSFQLLDSIYKDVENKPVFGPKLLRTNAMIGGEKMEQLSSLLLKNIVDQNKSEAVLNFIYGLSWNEEYYKAIKCIPLFASSKNEFEFYIRILECELTKFSKKMEFMPPEYSFYPNSSYEYLDLSNEMDVSFAADFHSNLNYEIRPGTTVTTTMEPDN